MRGTQATPICSVSASTGVPASSGSRRNRSGYLSQKEREVSTMKFLRALVGSLLWILAGVLGLVAALLCLTVILLPLGIPLFMLARKLFRFSMTFFLPRKMRHPAQELGKSARGKGKNLKDSVGGSEPRLKKAKKSGQNAAKAGRSFVKQQRKRVA